MDVDQEIKKLKAEEKQLRSYPVCCWPASDSGLRLWGPICVVIGGIWLLSNLDLVAVIVWPLFFIGLGLFCLSRPSQLS